MVNKILDESCRQVEVLYPFISKGRTLVWKRAQGLWKDRKQDPIQELNLMRKSWTKRSDEI